jgi:hypothetical protein
MKYFVNLFSPETWERFREKGSSISGFRETQRPFAAHVSQGDVLMCYLTGFSRWVGALQVEEGPFHDDTPLFSDPDPFTLRFRVRPIAVLAPEFAIPISDDRVWSRLSFTRNAEKGTSQWTGRVRSSLTQLSDEDGSLLLDLLQAQTKEQRFFPISEQDRKRAARKARIPTLEGDVAVAVPEKEDLSTEGVETSVTLEAHLDRQSLTIQARLAEIGARMHFRVWLPPSDRNRISSLVPESTRSAFLDRLPLNYDDTTLRTIEQIDVIWLRGRAMARAFEVEHTTAVYSGILRMADLLALQPNMNIRLHIVAPDERREKVKQEITRPVFSLLQSGPLYDRCTFLSYSAVDQLQAVEHLQYMSDEIIGEYEESAED